LLWSARTTRLPRSDADRRSTSLCWCCFLIGLLLRFDDAKLPRAATFSDLPVVSPCAAGEPVDDLPADLGVLEVDGAPSSALRHQLQVPYDPAFGYQSVQYLIHVYIYIYIYVSQTQCKLCVCRISYLMQIELVDTYNMIFVGVNDKVLSRSTIEANSVSATSTVESVIGRLKLMGQRL
jgi:hypothetical protein